MGLAGHGDGRTASSEQGGAVRWESASGLAEGQGSRG
jgi:hypothetical protein